MVERRGHAARVSVHFLPPQGQQLLHRNMPACRRRVSKSEQMEGAKSKVGHPNVVGHLSESTMKPRRDGRFLHLPSALLPLGGTSDWRIGRCCSWRSVSASTSIQLMDDTAFAVTRSGISTIMQSKHLHSEQKPPALHNNVTNQLRKCQQRERQRLSRASINQSGGTAPKLAHVEIS